MESIFTLTASSRSHPALIPWSPLLFIYVFARPISSLSASNRIRSDRDRHFSPLRIFALPFSIRNFSPPSSFSLSLFQILANFVRQSHETIGTNNRYELGGLKIRFIIFRMTVDRSIPYSEDPKISSFEISFLCFLNILFRERRCFHLGNLSSWATNTRRSVGGCEETSR